MSKNFDSPIEREFCGMPDVPQAKTAAMKDSHGQPVQGSSFTDDPDMWFRNLDGYLFQSKYIPEGATPVTAEVAEREMALRKSVEKGWHEWRESKTHITWEEWLMRMLIQAEARAGEPHE